MKKKCVLLIGPMPPPSGGVSTHLSRILMRSKAEEGIDLSVFDIRRLRLHTIDACSRNLFRIVYKYFSSDIIHIHISRKHKLKIAAVSKFIGKKVIYTHHNSRNLQEELTLKIMRAVDKVILVRPVKDVFSREIQKKCVVIPAYLHAPAAASLPDKLLHQFSGGAVLFAHCYQIKNNPLLIEGKDLYGFDLIFSAVEKLVNDQSEKQIILFLADPANAMKQYYSSKMLELAAYPNLKIIYWSDVLDFSSALKYCTILIRATRSEGDAISVREALHAGVPVIASDCVERPPGVIVFSSGNEDDLFKAISNQLENPVSQFYPQEDYALEMFKIYRSI